jgi:hypothetical protein
MHAAESLLDLCGVAPRYAETVDAISDDLAHEAPPDAVLCNLDLPGLTEKLFEFRKIQPGVPWIAFSNWTESPDEWVKNCFSAFIDRPIKPEQLYEALLQLQESKP